MSFGKKVMVGVSLLSLFLPSLAMAQFSDVSSATDYNEAISWMNENNVIEGYSDGRFRPDLCVNRVEMLKMLYLTMEVDVTRDLSANAGWYGYFSDVDETQWYWSYLRYALGSNTVEGYPDQTFRPTDCVNRVEAMKMAVLGFGEGQISTNRPFYGSFADEINDLNAGEWFYKYVDKALLENTVGLKHMTGVFGTNRRFHPGGNMTRGEVAEMLYRMKALNDSDANRYEEGMVPDSISVAVLNNTKHNFVVRYDSDVEVRGDEGLGYSYEPEESDFVDFDVDGASIALSVYYEGNPTPRFDDLFDQDAYGFTLGIWDYNKFDDNPNVTPDVSDIMEEVINGKTWYGFSINNAYGYTNFGEIVNEPIMLMFTKHNGKFYSFRFLEEDGGTAERIVSGFTFSD